MPDKFAHQNFDVCYQYPGSKKCWTYNFQKILWGIFSRVIELYGWHFCSDHRKNGDEHCIRVYFSFFLLFSTQNIFFLRFDSATFEIVSKDCNPQKTYI